MDPNDWSFEVKEVRSQGLTILWEPSPTETVIADIVFIHGLQGHPRDTWTREADLEIPNIASPIQKSKKSRFKSLFKKKETITPPPQDSPSRAQTAVFWPYHLLKETCPQSRILTWGYDSKITNFFGGPAAQSSILQYARKLLGDLSGERESYADRPIIFVVHSLGGIVLKQALLFAERSDISEWKETFLSTRALIFLGTPHSGSLFSATGESIRTFVQAIGFDTAGQNLQALRPDSALLEQNRDDFIKLYNRVKSFEICTFQEQYGMKGIDILGLNNKVVPDTSSEFPGCENKFPIFANHIMMSRFSGVEDDGYKQVSREIKKVCNKVEKENARKKALERLPALSEAQYDLVTGVCKPEYTDSLWFSEMNERQQQVEEVPSESYSWIFDDENYRNWKDDGYGLLAIRGKPGTGKSTLLKKIYSSFKKDNTKVITLAFFFHRRGVLLQKNQTGMFRTLLYQLFTQAPFVASEFGTIYEERCRHQGKAGQDWHWKVDELKGIFDSALLNAAKNRRIRIFVDALDEAQAEITAAQDLTQENSNELSKGSGEITAQVIADYLYKLNGKLRAERTATSICFSCRHLPVVRVSEEEYEVIVEYHNYDDLSNFTRDELKRKLKGFKGKAVPTEVQDTLHKTIVEKSANIFIWAVFVIPFISNLYNERKPLGIILQRVNSLHTNLHQTYKEILQEVINPEDRPATLHLLQWIFLAMRPLSVTELRYALVSDDRLMDPSKGSCEDMEGFVHEDNEMEEYIHVASGGLAEVQDHYGIHYNGSRVGPERVIQFIHQSVSDFLSKDQFRCLELKSDQVELRHGHQRLSRSCLNYLNLADTIQTADESIRWRLKERLPFVSYATEFWFIHGEKAERDGISQADLLHRFKWPSKGLIRSWETWSNVLGTNIGFKTNPGASLLHVAAASNLQTTVEELLHQGADINETDNDGNQAFFYASQEGHQSMVELLQKHCADVEHWNNKGENALYTAAHHGQYLIVQMLLQLHMNPNAAGPTPSKYRNPLQAAASSGNEPVVRLLLEKGAEVNAQGGQYGNALQAAAAAFGDNEAVVRLLLEKGAEVNAQGGEFGGQYGNAIQAAGLSGNEPVVRLLLEKGAEAQDGEHGNALLLQ
ncbi:hypothetical protein BP6252_13337 [Coleophoma cylindrospora]|uniref:Nephrocystin 3-like N-terminal domain-containing protein n=1 Tax=Coleophoma cylindrospora TaxID=1849047 RepID=A0A3D8QAQ6_9HELO|nr:hypothetical protein BP6252_13337 [Coleophoma cylindrospora]